MSSIRTVLQPRPILLSVTAALVAGLLPATASAQRTADILPFYNAERTANGLPTVTQVNGPQEMGCANHLGYMEANGNQLVHGETPGNPGYTPTGNFQDGAGGSEVLASGAGWGSGSDPWETAPIHLYLMLDPTVASTGYADDGQFACQRMAGGADGPTAPLSFYAWSFIGGRTGVPASEQAGEGPYTPQQLVGIPADQTTGPNLLLFSAGDKGKPLSASLTGPGGVAVAVMLVNVDSVSAVGTGGWFNGGGVLIPPAPLAPASTYQATVVWSDQGQQATQQFSFQTASSPTPTTPPITPPITPSTGLRCRVPSLRGRSLAVARSRLRAAGCRLGHVTRRRGGHGRMRVLAQRPAAGVQRPAGTRVTLTLRRR